MASAPTVVAQGQQALRQHLLKLERALKADVLAVIGAIVPGAERKVRDALEKLATRRPRLAVILQTGGGVVEVAERMVNVFRHFYREVVFIVPDVALSAGTVLVMSGDEIWMDYYSCLGPIDPQIERTMKDGTKRLVPALSYLSQFNRLVEKSAAGELTTAEMVLLTNFDLAELHAFEEAKEQAVGLIKAWLVQYKFKDWNETQTRKAPVSQAQKEAQAEQIAEKLSAHEHWHSHGRGIPMSTLQNELGLRITDFGVDPVVRAAIRNYFDLAISYMQVLPLAHLVHGREYL